jgi:hypothetical protein
MLLPQTEHDAAEKFGLNKKQLWYTKEAINSKKKI